MMRGRLISTARVFLANGDLGGAGSVVSTGGERKFKFLWPAVGIVTRRLGSMYTASW